MHTVAALALTLALSAPAPNDGVVIETGSAMSFTKSTQIQMVSEDIRLSLDDERATVGVEFVFKNHGRAATVSMGFPDYGGGDVGDTRSRIEQFESWVDGKPTSVVLRPLEAGDSGYKSVWVKKVSFQAGQTRRVRVHYEAPLGGSIAGDRATTYILVTGATWARTIQKAKITVDWSRMKRAHRPVMRFTRLEGSDFVRNWEPIGTKSESIEFHDLKPDFDLTVTSWAGFVAFRINGVPIWGYLLAPYPQGKRSDMQIPMQSLGALFGEKDGLWTHPAAGKFGGRIELSGSSAVLLGGRRLVPLRRPVEARTEGTDASKYLVQWVFLRDVVEAAGGSYHTDSPTGWVDLYFPARRK